MKLQDFDYDLPPELIAQHPPAARGDSRLMVLNRGRKTIEHRRFDDLPDYIRPGDLLVVNDSRVVPARVEGKKPTGGRVSILFLDETEDGATCLISGTRPIPGGVITLPGDIPAVIVERKKQDDGGTWVVRARFPGGLFGYLETWGRPPLPPYIKRRHEDDPTQDRDRYQTVYARDLGSAAAPTAGLHFTDPMIRRIEAGGGRVEAVTLHVGTGTFLPIRSEAIDRHRMHAERYVIPHDTARAVRDVKRDGARVIAVGTTTVRALESAAIEDRVIENGGAEGPSGPEWGATSLFIRPGFSFRVTDCLVTNFHLPRSTLLVLVSAFAGHRFILDAYREAVKERYRFFSYGDAMLII